MRRRRTRTRAAAPGALLPLLLGALLACGPGDARDRVVARLSDPVVQPPLPVAPRTFGTATRAAARAPADGRFEVSLARPPRRLRFSIALHGPAACAAAVRFSVLARRADGWNPVHAERLPPAPTRWQDRQLDLAAAAPGSTRFAFVSAPEWVHAEQARRCGPKLEAWWGSLAFLGPGGPRPAARTTPPAGIVLISLDTLGAAHLSGFSGAPGVSPGIDAWLADAFSFRHAIAQYGHTRPSTASLLSGHYPHRHGASPENLIARFESLVPRLADAGYATVAFTEGAYVSASFGFADGFDAYDDGRRGLQTAAHTHAAETFARAGDWLERHGAAGPFFLFVHTYEVHIPYTPRDREARQVARRLSPGVERFFTPELQLHATQQHSRTGAALDADELAHLAALYAAEIHHLDRVLEGFLGRLAALGLADDTLVVLTSDHGEQFGEGGRVTHGQSLHNRVLHVPLGFRWPGRIVAGESRDPVELIDVLPTILELAGLEAPPGLDGASLAPGLLGREARAPRPAFSELPTSRWECERLGLPYRCGLHRYAVQTGRFKLERSAVPAGERLIDLADDPLEARDVSAEHPEERARLHELLEPFARRARRAWESRAGGARPVLDDHLREQIRALGYAE